MKYNTIKALIVSISGFCIVVLPFLYMAESPETMMTSAVTADNGNLIILDAGHGGEDGGAIGVGGILEKDLNLAITLKTNNFFRFLGYDTILTRSEDKMTCDDNLKGQRSKKVSDIKNRFALLEENDCLCFISIHQNFFGGNAHGAQMFYGPRNDESKILAQILQESIKAHIQPENERVIKPADNNIYILYNTKKVAVLAECGFISNNDDATALQDGEYQSKLAFVIAESTAKYLAEREEQKWEN